MSELKEKSSPEDDHLTHSFILQKCHNPSKRYPHPYLTQTTARSHSPIKKHSAKLVFNSDRKSYTPSFCFPGDQEALQASDKEFLTFFEEKVEATTEKGTIVLLSQAKMVPKPISEYCMVCLKPFSDYLKHLSSQSHHKNIASCSVECFIEELVEGFGNKRRRPCDPGEGRKRQKCEQNAKAGGQAQIIFRENSTKLPNSSEQVTLLKY